MLNIRIITSSLQFQYMYKIHLAQRAMERVTLDLQLADRVPNVEIRLCTKIEDVGTCIAKLKWRWAGHLDR